MSDKMFKKNNKPDPYAPFIGKSYDEIDKRELLKVVISDGIDLYSVGRVLMLNSKIILELMERLDQLQLELDNIKQKT